MPALLFFIRSFSQNTCDTLSFNRANEYMQQESYDSALAFYTHVIAGCPDFTPAYLNRGIAYYYLNHVDKANEDFEATIGMAKHKYRVVMVIANVLFENEDYNGAYEYFDKACKINNAETEPYFKMGRCLWLDRVRILQANEVEDYAQDTLLILT
jgi:tetratricopeptide (TPR) repeat protein